LRFITFESTEGTGIAVRSENGEYHGLTRQSPHYPGDLRTLLAKPSSLARAGRRLAEGPRVDIARVRLLPPIPDPVKIICIGLNYASHTAESGFEQPTYPAVFARYASTLVGHDAPIVRPTASVQLDYEGELAAVIGMGGRHISTANALDHVAAYSIFNDASVRDYQFKSPQWTMGKNFDATGAFGPEIVSADELAPGCAGSQIQTRLNGDIVQDASIDDLIFDVAALVSLLSEVMTLTPGDIIATGTPSGAGFARTPPLWMKPGDVCEVEIEGIGTLRNPIVQEN
jgi:acylpyruvate hydrolase